MRRTIIILMALVSFAGTALAADKGGTTSCPPNSRKKSDGTCVCNDGYYKRYGRCERIAP